MDNIPVCGVYGTRHGNHLIIPAQGIALSIIPTNEGTVYLWQGERWLSAPNNNPLCPDECRPQNGTCKEPKDYIKGHGYMYWVPLEFEDNGDVKKFMFADDFSLNLLDE